MIPVYLIFGPQGSGKSTQGQRLAEHLGVPYFNAGSALRNFVKADSKDGEMVSSLMQRGGLVPNNVLRRLFVNFIDTTNPRNGFVADGFPRNETQVALLEDLAQEHNWLVRGIYIHISDETAKARLAKRVTKIDGKMKHRDDDKPAIVEQRLTTFRKETMPVVNWLKNRGQLVEIDGEADIDNVFKAIKDKLING